MRASLPVQLCLVSLLAGAGAQAAVTVMGSSTAAKCYESAERGSTFTRDCDAALRDPDLLVHDRASTLVNRGVVYNNRRDYSRALADFEAALEIDEELPEAYLNRGNSRFFQDRLAEAIADYTRAIDLDIERMPVARYNRSLAYGRLGDLASARADLEAALALAPEFDEAKAQLARLDKVLAQSTAPAATAAEPR